MIEKICEINEDYKEQLIKKEFLYKSSKSVIDEVHDFLQNYMKNNSDINFNI